MGIQTARLRGLLKRFTKEQLAGEFSYLGETVTEQDVFRWSRGDFERRMGARVRFKMWTLSMWLLARYTIGGALWWVFRVVYYTLYKLMSVIGLTFTYLWKLKPKSDQIRLL